MPSLLEEEWGGRKHTHTRARTFIFFLFKDTRNIHFTARRNTGWKIHAKYLFQSISPELDFTGHLLITRCGIMPPCASQSLPDKLPDSGGVRARVTSAPLIGHKDLPRRNLVALHTSSPGPSNWARLTWQRVCAPLLPSGAKYQGCNETAR